MTANITPNQYIKGLIKVKKVVILAICLIITTITLSVCGCKKPPIRQGQVSSKSFVKPPFSYTFPYIVSGVSSSEKSGRSFLPASVEEEVSAPSNDTYLGVVRLISNLEQITAENYLQNEERLLYVNDCYNALSETDKHMVLNYGVLQESINVFNGLLNAEFSPKADAFVSEVDSLNFEFTPAFKQSLEKLSSDYDKLHATFKDRVFSSKTILDEYVSTFADYESAKEVVLLIDGLPQYVNDINIGQFKKTIIAYNDLTEKQKLLIDGEYAEKVNNVKKELTENYLFFNSLTVDNGLKNDVFNILNAKVVNGNFNYDGKTVVCGAVCDINSKIIVSACYGGEIKLYLANASDKLTININKGSKVLTTILACENNVITYLLEDIGSYSITFENQGSTTIYALEFC